MPLIPYPDIPNLPGVPALPRLPHGPIALASAGVALLTTPNIVAQSQSAWQITYAGGGMAVQPDSVIDFDYRGTMEIPEYPMEAGSFASYNKVYKPFEAKMTCACNGNGVMTRSAFLSALEALRLSLVPLAIITPDDVYQPCNVVNVDFRREARSGVSLILAHVWFREIRIYGVGVLQTAAPSGAPAQSLGQVAPTTPTTGQLGAYSATGVS